jgi:hypothetical protein
LKRIKGRYYRLVGIARRNSDAKIGKIWKKTKKNDRIFAKKCVIGVKKMKKAKKDLVFPMLLCEKFDQRSKGFSFWNKLKGGKKENNAFSVQK